VNEFGQRICLNMIVKNEAPVIRRCLDSVRSLIDTWVIVDTGSTDGTQQIIREHLQDLPGELTERPWVDFAHNRSEALDYARGRADYTLLIDADETLAWDDGFRLPKLTADSYHILVYYAGCTYLRKQLVRSALPWRYQGVVHEYIHCDVPHSERLLNGLWLIPHTDGARARDPDTYRRDALMLERALLHEPDNARYVFYLAQSYRDGRDWEPALRHYRRRVEMGGWPDEVWYSMYQIAQLKSQMEKPWAEVMQDYLAAYQFRPDRAEPLYRIGIHYQAKGEYHTAHVFFSRARQIPNPSSDRLFVESDVYQFLLPLEYAVSCFYVGDQSSAIETNNWLLRGRLLPPAMIEKVITNRRFSLNALFPPPNNAVAEPGPLQLCVPFRDPGAEMDDLIDSLLRQEFPLFQAFFIDDGSSDDHSRRIPLDDPRFSLVRRDAPQGWEACVEQFVSQRCRSAYIVFALSIDDRLADHNALNYARAAFQDPACMLLYGQHRLPSGALGDAEPAANEAIFLERTAVLTSRSPVVFRAALLTAAPPGVGQIDTETSCTARSGSRLVGTLLRAAGFQRTRFSDAVLTVAAESDRRENAAINLDAGVPRADTGALGTDLPPTLASLGALPTISCLMVTYDRMALAKRSIECFAKQTYPRKELVIVTNGAIRYRRALERFVAQRGLTAVRFVFLDDDSIALGRLRNLSLDAAQGELICQWDDDDCNHPDRLMLQAEHMFKEKARACFMTDHLQFLEDTRAVVWVDWTLGGRSRVDQLLPGTVMMFKDPQFRYPETGEYARRGEDTAFLCSIYETVPVAYLMGMGWLYLYTFHGRNTFSKEHHHRLSTFSRTSSEMRERAETIRRALALYPVAKPVVVSGRDGPAFVLND
jgi:glycosyltransferase involved in cell wall biosynthesis